MRFPWDQDPYSDYDEIQPTYWRIQPGSVKFLTIALAGPACIVLLASVILGNIPDSAVAIAFAAMTLVGLVQAFFLIKASRYDG